jgi:hypothetical protein
MTGPFADRLFRIAFALAGCYNLAFGLWAGFWPWSFFRVFDIAPPRYPGIWACLGMVVGVYGLLYWHAAWKLQTAWPIIAVGLLGKVLGPIGMALSFGDDWPRRLGMICVYNDLIWWLPFGLFLVRGTALADQLVRWAPWCCVILHVVALGTMAAFLRRGMLSQPDPWFRAAYITDHATLWSIGWALWMIAAMSLVGFYAWWASRLSITNSEMTIDEFRDTGSTWGIHHSSFAHSSLTTIAVVIAAFGTVFDFSGEGLSILLLVERAAGSIAGELHSSWDAAAFTNVERGFTLFSAGAANLLYTIGGILLTLATPNLPAWVRAAMWLTWLAGIAMTVAGVMNHVGGLIASTVVLFPLLILWTAWMGARWRGP